MTKFKVLLLQSHTLNILKVYLVVIFRERSQPTIREKRKTFRLLSCMNNRNEWYKKAVNRRCGPTDRSRSRYIGNKHVIRIPYTDVICAGCHSKFFSRRFHLKESQQDAATLKNRHNKIAFNRFNLGMPKYRRLTFQNNYLL